jgi:DNA-binding beta-propeller fold protein YncE
MKKRWKVVLVLLGVVGMVIVLLIFYPAPTAGIPTVHRSYKVLIDPGTNDPHYILHNPLTIRIGPDDNIYILDQGNSRIMVYDRRMRFLRQIGRVGQGPGEFIEPTDFDFDGQGNLYVAEFINSRISVLDAYGNFLKSLRVNNLIPRNWRLSVRSDGFVYFSTFDDSLVSVLSPDGQEAFRFGTLFQHPRIPSTRHHWNTVFLDFDEHENLWVLYEAKPIVRCYTKNGILLFEKELSAPDIEEARKQERSIPPDRGHVIYFHDVRSSNSSIFASGNNYVYELDSDGNLVKIHSVDYPKNREQTRYGFIHRFDFDSRNELFFASEIIEGRVFRF